MKLAVAVAAALAAVNMTADGGMYEKYEFKGLEKPVYYLATGPIGVPDAGCSPSANAHGAIAAAKADKAMFLKSIKRYYTINHLR